MSSGVAREGVKDERELSVSLSVSSSVVSVKQEREDDELSEASQIEGKASKNSLRLSSSKSLLDWVTDARVDSTVLSL